MFSAFLQPFMHILERLSICHVVDEESTCGGPVVGSGDRLEGFLASGVPYLQLDRIFVDVDQFSAELDADRHFVPSVELAVNEPKQQAALADAWMTRDYPYRQ